MTAPGLQDEQDLRDAGFSLEEIGQYRADTKKELFDAGFSEKEVMDHFGIVEPDMASTRKMLETNLAAHRAEKEAQATETKPAGVPQDPEQLAAQTWLEALEAGFQLSTAGLVARGKKPSVVVPEDAPTAYRILQQAGVAAGDIPAAMVGAIEWGAAGTAVGGPVGGLLAGGAGAMAVPAGIRKALMDHYEKGEIDSFGEFWDRAAGVFIETAKGGVVGAATAGVGKAVGLTPALSGTTRSLTILGAEAATMTTVGKALEGEVPRAQDFLDGAVLLAGFKVATYGATVAPVVPSRVAGKLRSLYGEAGVKPGEVVEQATIEPVVKQDLLSSNAEFPRTIPVDGKQVGPIEVMPETQKAASEMIAPPKKPELTPDADPLTSAIHETNSRVRSLSEIDRTLPLKQQGEKWWRDFLFNIVDRYNGIREVTEALAGERELSTVQDPYKLARLSVDAGSTSKKFLEFNTVDFHTKEKVTGKSMGEIIEPVRPEIDQFRAYLVSRRALEIESKGKVSGFDAQKSKLIVDSLSQKYEPVFKELVDYRNRTLKYISDSGILSPELYEKLVSDNTAYVPFHRWFGEETHALGASGPEPVFNPIKELKGSERQIIDPLEVIARDTDLFIKLAERNRSLVALAELAETSKDGALYAQKTKGKLKPIKVTEGELAKFFEENGLEEVGLDRKSTEEMFTIFRGKYAPLGKDEFALFRNGKREVWKGSPELVRSVQALTPKQWNVVFRMMEPFTRSLRAGATLTLEFSAGNFLRDQFQATIISKGKYSFIKDFFNGMGSIISKDKAFQEFLSSGAGNATINHFDTYLKDFLPKKELDATLINRTLNVLKTPLDVVGAGFEILRNVSDAVEKGTRVGYYKRLTEANPSMSVFDKAFQTRELTLDFQKSGAVGQGINMISAFWNARVQGLVQFGEAIKKDPVGVMSRAVGYITLPSLLLWLKAKDDPRYQKAQRWQKDLFWFVGTEKHAYWIPRPHELGIIFGALPERLFEQFFTDHPRALKDFEETLLSTFGDLVPYSTALTPVAEQIFNQSFLTKSPIVPSRFDDVLPWAQYTPNTSQTAKLLGQTLSKVPFLSEKSIASPMVIDNYIRGWTGGLGRYFTQVVDQALDASGVTTPLIKPIKQLEDLPIIRSFMLRNPEGLTQPVDDFYERSGHYKKYLGTMDHLRKTLQVEEFKKFVEDPLTRDNIVRVDQIRSAITSFNQNIQKLHYVKTMSPEEKYDKQERLYLLMINAAEHGNKLLDSMEKKKGAH